MATIQATRKATQSVVGAAQWYNIIFSQATNWMRSARMLPFTDMATAGQPCEQFCVLQRSEQTNILMVICAEQPEELANALSDHHTFTVRVLLTATTITSKHWPKFQDRLTNAQNKLISGITSSSVEGSERRCRVERGTASLGE